MSKDKARLDVSQLSAIATNCRNANRALRGKSKKPRSANLRKLKTTSLIFLFSFALRGLKTFRPIAPTATKKRYDTSCQGGDLPQPHRGKYYLDCLGHGVKNIGLGEWV